MPATPSDAASFAGHPAQSLVTLLAEVDAARRTRNPIRRVLHDILRVLIVAVLEWSAHRATALSDAPPEPDHGAIETARASAPADSSLAPDVGSCLPTPRPPRASRHNPARARAIRIRRDLAAHRPRRPAIPGIPRRPAIATHRVKPRYPLLA